MVCLHVYAKQEPFPSLELSLPESHYYHEYIISVENLQLVKGSPADQNLPTAWIPTCGESDDYV